MNPTKDQAVHLSDKDQALVQEFAKQLRDEAPEFKAKAGEDTPRLLNEIFHDIIAAICEGRAISISTMRKLLTTTATAPRPAGKEEE